MNVLELTSQVKTIIHQTIEIPEDQLDWDTRLGDFDVDSLDILKMAYAFEKTFQIRVAPAELVQVETLGDVVTGLQRKLNIP